MKRRWWRVAGVLALCATSAAPQSERPPRVDLPQRSAAAYPPEWEVPVRPGSKLDALRQKYATAALPAGDLQDRSALPRWFRAYLRASFRGLPEAGAHQYPLESARLLAWMTAHPNLVPARRPGRPQPGRGVAVGAGVRLSDAEELNSESALARDPLRPDYLVAAANTDRDECETAASGATDCGFQRQFHSHDGGKTWLRSRLPFVQGTALHADPAVAIAPDAAGTAWSATIGFKFDDYSVVAQDVQLFKSVDHGATWQFWRTVAGAGAHDKEVLAIDAEPGSPHRGNLYLAWNQLDRYNSALRSWGVRFARATAPATDWTAQTLSSDNGAGVQVAPGPAGEVYVAWHDSDPDASGRYPIRVRKSVDGGASFAAARTIAATRGEYILRVPAMCGRKALIYLALAVDRSKGARRGRVYAAWPDSDGTSAGSCDTTTQPSTGSNVYFSASTDGGATWSTPKLVHKDLPLTDQFNPSLDVDPADGRIHVTFYDTRDDSCDGPQDTGCRKQAHLYYASSGDGGLTWEAETRITEEPTDETVAGADPIMQYGDYNGLVARDGVAVASWTDRRATNPTSREQIFTAAIGREPRFPLAPCATPGVCAEPISMGPGRLVIRCEVENCLVLDRIQENCRVKFECPACRPEQSCPAHYRFAIGGMKDAWSVDVIGPRGEAVAVERAATRDGLIVGFRPDAAVLREQGIGAYYFVFRPRSTAALKTDYALTMSLLDEGPLLPRR